jgi:cell wall assembly regulator SMI1
VTATETLDSVTDKEIELDETFPLQAQKLTKTHDTDSKYKACPNILQQYKIMDSKTRELVHWFNTSERKEKKFKQNKSTFKTTNDQTP